MSSSSNEKSLNPNRITNAREYVKSWVELNQVQVQGQGNLVDRRGRPRDQITNSMWLDYIENYMEAVQLLGKLPKLQETDLRKALDEYVHDQLQVQRNLLIEKLKCEAEDLEPVRKFVELLTGSRSEKLAHVFAHWMWNVKLKLDNRLAETTYHMLLVLTGKQGSGKTSVVKLMTAPFTGYILSADIPTVADSRMDEALSKNLIATLDELQYAERTNVDALKRKITAGETSSRQLHTHNSMTYPQRCSFIGTTNRSVAEAFSDRTGMRRFYEIKTLDKLDQQATENFDYLAMWKGVDEARSRGYIENYLDEVSLDQESLRHIDDIESFLTHFKIIKEAEANTVDLPVKTSDLYQQYVLFSKENGHKPQPANWFGRRLNSFGITSKRVTYRPTGSVRNKQVNTYPVNSDSELPAYVYLDDADVQAKLVERDKDLPEAPSNVIKMPGKD